MRLRDALRRAAGYHLRALPPTVVGLGLAGAGVWYGLDGGTALASVTTNRLASGAGLVAAGVVVAAVCRTAVRLDATAAAVEDSVGGSGVDEDDLRETVALAAERAVADSVDGATTEMEARVVEAVTEAVAAPAAPTGGGGARASSNAGPGGGPDPAGSADSATRAEAADSQSAEPDALADATRRASERVESYLETDDPEADVGEFRQLAEGAAVLDGEESADADDGADRAVVRTDGRTEAADDDAEFAADREAATPGDGAEILDDDPADPDLPDGGGEDDAEIIDADTEMVFGSDVRDPDES